MVDIAAEKADLGKGGGEAAIAPSSQGLELIEDEPFVNVNIFSDRTCRMRPKMKRPAARTCSRAISSTARLHMPRPAPSPLPAA